MAAISTSSTAARTDESVWLASPAFDLVALSNLWWLLAFAPWALNAEGTSRLEFWQVFFLTTPHRWITLLLVAAEPERRGGRDALFVGLAVAAALIVGAWAVVFESLRGLLFLGLLWNAWHFASQHAGVLRLYARRSPPGGAPRVVEMIWLRTFIIYTAIRVTIAAPISCWCESFSDLPAVLSVVDLLMLPIPLVLVGWELLDRPWRRAGKVCYVVSVAGLYTSLLWASHVGAERLLLSLGIAAAAFHAVEYLAVVTFYAQRRAVRGSDSMFRRWAQQWPAVLALHVVCFGLLGAVGVQWIGGLWLALNLWAELLHYAFDGMIWKLRAAGAPQAFGLRPAGDS